MHSPARAGLEIHPTAAASCRLPVSGLPVEIRHPTGREEMLLLERPAGSAEVALALAQRLGRAADGTPVAWCELPVTDLDAFLLYIRQALIGDRLTSDVLCRAPDCGRRIEISFSIATYIQHHQPRRSGNPRRGWILATSDEAPGWFLLTPKPTLAGSRSPELRFRLPTIGDELAAASLPDGEPELVRRCIRPDNWPLRTRRIIEAAMQVMAPPLSGDLEGICPDCGARITVYFDPRQFCLQELRNRAAFVYEDIDTLAQRYCWSEHAILAMPNTRRASYAELARQNRSV
jgi:hypothetical protein